MTTCKNCDWFIFIKYLDWLLSGKQEEAFMHNSTEDDVQYDGFCCCPDKKRKNIRQPYERIKQDQQACKYFEPNK